MFTHSIIKSLHVLAGRVGNPGQYSIPTSWPGPNTWYQNSDPNRVLAGREPGSSSMTRPNAVSLTKTDKNFQKVMKKDFESECMNDDGMRKKKESSEILDQKH